MGEGSEFCFCRKRLSKQEIKWGKRRRLQDERSEIMAQLAELGEAGKTVDSAEEAKYALTSQVLFDKLAAATRAHGAQAVRSVGMVFQFVVADAGPEGRFVLDLKNGRGSTKV